MFKINGRSVTLLLLCLVTLAAATASAQEDDDFQSFVQPFFAQYCNDCHSSPEPKGRMDFSAIQSPESVESSFDTIRSAIKAMERGDMPPADKAQPGDQERQRLRKWFNARYVDIAPRAAPLHPRRLSAHEYRNTLRSLIGFDLEVVVTQAEETVSEKSMVMKLLPTDPPGASGYRNDTHRNPISTIAWDRYSELADLAIEDLFSSRRRDQLELLTGKQSREEFTQEQAEALMRTWLARVYRRPVDAGQVEQIVQRVTQANNPLEAVQFEIKASLVSPRFLYRSLLAGQQAAGDQPVDDYELAERLSYFLWADMPDAELLAAAAAGQLQDEVILKQQVQRLVSSDRSGNLATDLATQWLSLDEINEVSDDVPVVVAYKSQAIDFIGYLIQNDRPLLELIDCKYEFINGFTARFYGEDRRQLKKHEKPAGIEVQIEPNQRIELIATRDRGGILTMPGILAMNRGAIIRGTWILERILGEPLPDPPANVGQVKPNQPGQQLTFRQRFEQHRSQASCAVCHDKIDPLGFVLESYDEGGALISQQPDTSGQLPSGETFANVRELKAILSTTRKRSVLRNIAVQFLSYALCRKIEYYDEPTIEAIVSKLDRSENTGTFKQLIQEIVLSRPFRQARFAGATP